MINKKGYFQAVKQIECGNLAYKATIVYEKKDGEIIINLRAV